MIDNGSNIGLFAGEGLAVPRLGNVQLRLHFLRRGTIGAIKRKGLINMKHLLVLIIVNILFMSGLIAQSKKINPFKRVKVPDSIAMILKQSYNGYPHKNILNLINKNDFNFKEGIYSFQGLGPHFPRYIFIYSKGKLFIFKNEASGNPVGVIQEFLECIKILDLNTKQINSYLKAISIYLEEEEGNSYGSEIKK